jgi:hypothetical protein
MKLNSSGGGADVIEEEEEDIVSRTGKLTSDEI